MILLRIWKGKRAEGVVSSNHIAIIWERQNRVKKLSLVIEHKKYMKGDYIVPYYYVIIKVMKWSNKVFSG